MDVTYLSKRYNLVRDDNGYWTTEVTAFADGDLYYELETPAAEAITTPDALTVYKDGTIYIDAYDDSAELTKTDSLIPKTFVEYSVPYIAKKTIVTFSETDTIEVSSTAGEDKVTINSDIEECYYGSASRNSKVSGSFPKLLPGEITVTLGAGITKVDITGNWRWH